MNNIRKAKLTGALINEPIEMIEAFKDNIALLQKDLSSIGINLNLPLYEVEIIPLNEMEKEDGFQITDFPMMKLIAQNVSNGKFYLGDVYYGIIDSIPVIAHQWDFTGSAFYTNKV